MNLPPADGFLPLLLLLLLRSIQGDPGGGAAVSVSPPPSPPPYTPAPHFTPFKPSVAVVVAVLTTTFSITFLLLLYARHCNLPTTTANAVYGSTPPSALSYSSNNNRKNSGVTRAVVDSLPVFRFGSLTGPKDGLDCAVCLSRFEPSEVLRLLPKCNHAFHVECVDTWLDAHSTCPLCRYRVDPEDVLLLHQQRSIPLHDRRSLPDAINNSVQTQRLSGRHSSAGERATNKLLQIILQSSSSRRSLDSRTKPATKKQEASISSSADAHPIPSSSVGFFEKSRKDGLLLASVDDRENFGKRFEHRIMISDQDEQQRQRWSDLQGSDLMYLRSEMIMNDSRCRYSSAHSAAAAAAAAAEYGSSSGSKDVAGGRIVINPRSVSEITVAHRRRDEDNGCNYENRRERRKRHVASVLSRWVSISSQRSQPVDHPLPL